ncbi:DUF6155 family protein [Parabacteroides goldsteinii]|jgi:hypothetical protein|uniref:DUF6155 family protein n=2 Tax=Parabacteroides goldsteinii TaxID=328812 RepID=UPI0031199D78
MCIFAEIRKNIAIMSKAQLKKHLSALNKEQIIEVMLELYDARKEAKEYLEFYLNPNEDEKLEEYKRIIRDEFFPRRGEPKCRFNICRKAISDFKKLKPHPACLADLMLYYIETGCEMTSMYGDMWEQYYTTLETNFAKAMELIAQLGYTKQFSKRIERMLKSIEDCGWGFPDALYDIYYEYKVD